MAALSDLRRLVVCDILCYMINKMSRVACKPLISAVLDFYSADDISLANEKFDELQIEKVLKSIRRRKDSVNRSNIEVDDIMSSLTYLDESINLNNLPQFVYILIRCRQSN